MSRIFKKFGVVVLCAKNNKIRFKGIHEGGSDGGNTFSED